MTRVLHGREDVAVLLDVDGVLVDTEASVLQLWADICDALGRRPPDATDRAHIVGCGVAHTISHLFGPAGPPAVEAAHAMLATLEPALAMVPVDGAATLVHELHERDVRVVLVTGASLGRLERVVEQLDIAGCLTATVTSGEASGKPDPEPYVLAATRAGVTPGACLVVEDAGPGVRSAVVAGTRCIGLARPGRTAADALRLAGAELVVESVPEVAAALRLMTQVHPRHRQDDHRPSRHTVPAPPSR